MATAPSLWQLNADGQLSLHFHPGQARAWNSRRRFVFVLSGTQGGKTSWGPWWLWREIYGAGNYPGCGPGDYIAATASYDLFKLKMLPALRETFEHVLRCARYWAGDRILELSDPRTGKFWAKRSDDAMWGRIILRSAEAGGGLESSTAKAAWLDEAGQDAFALEDWEAVLRRLSLSQGRVLATTTIYNLGWIKVDAYDQWVAGDTDFEFIQFASAENPAFPQAEYQRAKRTMPLWRFLMFYAGQFSRPAGLIYDCFDEDIHLVAPFPIPPSWPRYVGIDFGGANTALLWVAENPLTHAYYLYRESLEGGKTTAQHAGIALEFAKAENVVGWAGGAKSETQQRMDWRNAHVPVREPVISDVEAGIDRVYSFFQDKQLFVFNTLRGIRDELGTYKRKLDKNGQPTEEIGDKRKFHRLDALRYLAQLIKTNFVSMSATQSDDAQQNQWQVDRRRNANAAREQSSDDDDETTIRWQLT